MSKKTFNYLVTQPYVNCDKLSNKQISKLLGSIEKVRIEIEGKMLNLRNVGKYRSKVYDEYFSTLINFHIDTTTLINMLKVEASYIGLSSTSITQISKK